jgi:hypothetical protein
MSALRWPAFTSTEIHEALRLALAASPLAHPPEANYRCHAEPDERPQGTGVTCLGDERNRAGAP